MEALYQYLVHGLFRGLLSGERTIIDRVACREGPVSFRDGILRFTLPGLFAFALENFQRDRPGGETIDPDDYIRFRETLYAHPTNTFLQHYGGIVDIETANENQQLTIYRLRRID